MVLRDAHINKLRGCAHRQNRGHASLKWTSCTYFAVKEEVANRLLKTCPAPEVDEKPPPEASYLRPYLTILDRTDRDLKNTVRYFSQTIMHPRNQERRRKYDRRLSRGDTQ